MQRSTGSHALEELPARYQSLDAVTAQHIARVLAMVEFDLEKASQLLEIGLSELVNYVARWDLRPTDLVPKRAGSASIAMGDQ